MSRTRQILDLSTSVLTDARRPSPPGHRGIYLSAAPVVKSVPGSVLYSRMKIFTALLRSPIDSRNRWFAPDLPGGSGADAKRGGVSSPESGVYRESAKYSHQSLISVGDAGCKKHLRQFGMLPWEEV